MLYYLRQEVIGDQADKILEGADSRLVQVHICSGPPQANPGGWDTPWDVLRTLTASVAHLLIVFWAWGCDENVDRAICVYLRIRVRNNGC